MPVEDKTNDITTTASDPNDGNYELENQFILRLPPAPAAALRAVVASGVLNLKDRLTIQIESDMRHCTVRFDGWILPSKIVDLPTIVESLKTLDGKLFYKTADICQMMICKEAVDEDRFDFDDGKKKDAKDKKYQWPHGITPPLKNVRKKRFRKTLKKKFVDVPEIEKEVKRLFKTDSEAISIRYEVVDAADDRMDIKNQNSYTSTGLMSNNSQSMDIVEHDLFGEVLSSSDEEDTRVQDSDENSRLSASNMRDSRMSKDNQGETRYVTEFTKGMLINDDKSNANNNDNTSTSYDISSESSTAAAAAVAALKEADASSEMNSANDTYISKLNELEEEINTIVKKRQAQEAEIASIENMALVQRFQDIIDELKKQEMEKRQQYDEILMMFNQ